MTKLSRILKRIEMQQDMYEKAGYKHTLKIKLFELYDEAIRPFENVYYNIRTFFTRIPIALRYFKFGMQDREWHEHGIYQLLSMKIRNMAYLQEHYGNSVNHLKTARRMRIVATLLDRVIQDDYDIEVHPDNTYICPYSRSGALYDKVRIRWEELNDGSGLYQMHTEGSELVQRAAHNTMALKENIRQGRKEEAFRLLAQHIDRWWD